MRARLWFRSGPYSVTNWKVPWPGWMAEQVTMDAPIDRPAIVVVQIKDCYRSPLMRPVIEVRFGARHKYTYLYKHVVAKSLNIIINHHGRWLENDNGNINFGMRIQRLRFDTWNRLTIIDSEMIPYCIQPPCFNQFICTVLTVDFEWLNFRNIIEKRVDPKVSDPVSDKKKSVSPLYLLPLFMILKWRNTVTILNVRQEPIGRIYFWALAEGFLIRQRHQLLLWLFSHVVSANVKRANEWRKPLSNQ